MGADLEDSEVEPEICQYRGKIKHTIVQHR